MNVDYVVGEDWQELFIEGKLATEGHTLKTMECLKEIANQWEDTGDRLFVSQWEVNQDWLEDCGSFPDKFDYIPKDMLELIEEISF